MASRKYDYQLKIFILGDSGVGKTNLLLRYTDSFYNSTQLTTIGPDFKVKYINLKGKLIKLFIFDRGGQELFHSCCEQYYIKMHGFILAYDVTDRNSFKNIINWIKIIEKSGNIKAIKVLVGLKCDKPDRVVTEEEGKKMANDYNMNFFESSAKINQNVNDLFIFLISEILQNTPKYKILGNLNIVKLSKYINK